MRGLVLATSREDPNLNARRYLEKHVRPFASAGALSVPVFPEEQGSDATGAELVAVDEARQR